MTTTTIETSITITSRMYRDLIDMHERVEDHLTPRDRSLAGMFREMAAYQETLHRRRNGERPRRNDPARVLRAIYRNGGEASLTTIRRMTGNSLNAQELHAAVAGLKEQGLVTTRTDFPAGVGRPATIAILTDAGAGEAQKVVGEAA